MIDWLFNICVCIIVCCKLRCKSVALLQNSPMFPQGWNRLQHILIYLWTYQFDFSFLRFAMTWFRLRLIWCCACVHCLGFRVQVLSVWYSLNLHNQSSMCLSFPNWFLLQTAIYSMLFLIFSVPVLIWLSINYSWYFIWSVKESYTPRLQVAQNEIQKDHFFSSIWLLRTYFLL